MDPRYTLLAIHVDGCLGKWQDKIHTHVLSLVEQFLRALIGVGSALVDIYVYRITVYMSAVGISSHCIIVLRGSVSAVDHEGTTKS